MEELCQMFYMKLDIGCINWIRNAVEHCELMMSSHKNHDSDIWTAMRSAFASDKVVDEMLPGIRVGVNVDPTTLSYGECGSLMTTIAQDYFSRMQYFPLMDTLRVGAWATWFTIVGLFLVFGFMYVGIFCTRKLEAFKAIHNPKYDCVDVVKSSTKATATDIEEHIDSPTKTIIIKVTETVNKRDDYGTFEFRNGHQKEYPYKRAAVEEILNLLENYPNKLKFVVSCDDEDVYEDVLKFNETEKLGKKSVSSIYLRSNSFLSTPNTLSRSRIPIAYKGNNIKTK